MKLAALVLLTFTACAIDADQAVTSTWWKPSGMMQLHWQLSTPFEYPRDLVPGAKVYDLDMEETKASAVASLHSIGAKTICYVSVGTYENFRQDAYKFPPSVLGNANGWRGERWLDVRRQDILLPIMKDRFEQCLSKGFDAIEPDNLDGWENNSGFPLSRVAGLSYVRAIATLAHSLGLSVGLKNLPDEAPGLVGDFDWTLNEECFRYSECSGLRSFITANKAVWNVEYSRRYPDCAKANFWHFNAQRRDLDLVGPTISSYKYIPCL